MQDKRFLDPKKLKEILSEHYAARLISEISTIVAIATEWMGCHRLRGALIQSIHDCAMAYTESGFKIMNYAFAKCIDFEDERFQAMLLEEIPTEDFDLESFVSDIEMDLLLRRYFNRLRKKENDENE